MASLKIWIDLGWGERLSAGGPKTTTGRLLCSCLAADFPSRFLHLTKKSWETFWLETVSFYWFLSRNKSWTEKQTTVLDGLWARVIENKQTGRGRFPRSNLGHLCTLDMKYLHFVRWMKHKILDILQDLNSFYIIQTSKVIFNKMLLNVINAMEFGRPQDFHEFFTLSDGVMFKAIAEAWGDQIQGCLTRKK